MKRKNLDAPQKVRTSLDELEVLSHLKGTIEWSIVKRVANRYVSNLRRKAFVLPENHPNFKLEHIDYTGQARGIRHLIKIIDNAGRKIEKKEKRKK